MSILTSCPSLHSQVSESLRAERLHLAGGRGAAGVSGSSASLCGSLPRQATPPVPPSKPLRDLGLLVGPAFGPQTLAVPPYTHNSPPAPPPSSACGRPEGDGCVRRGSFVERCQERAKGSEAVGVATESVRRSLAVCSELEARFGLRTPATFSTSPGPRPSPGTPSSSRNRPAATSPSSPAPPASVSPSRTHSAASSPHGAPPSAEEPGSAEGPAAPEGPASPKPHMNETSF